MSERDFLLPDAKKRAADAIREIEAETAAEVVVAVRHAAGAHHATSLAFGAGTAAVALLVMLVSPQVYDVRTMPLDALLAFALGFLSSTFVTGLRRALTPEARRELAAANAADVAFSEHGIHETRARTGILVYVALFERTAVVVTDQGVPTELMAEAFAGAKRALADSVRRLDYPAFLSALSSLREPLAEVLPRQPDDANELADQVI